MSSVKLQKKRGSDEVSFEAMIRRTRDFQREKLVLVLVDSKPTKDCRSPPVDPIGRGIKNAGGAVLSPTYFRDVTFSSNEFVLFER